MNTPETNPNTVEHPAITAGKDLEQALATMDAAKVAKEEPKKCPFCGITFYFGRTFGVGVHPKGDCPLSEIAFFLEAWNRRASPWRDISTCDLVGVEVLLHQVGNLCGPSIGIRLSRHGDWLLHDDSRVKLYPTHWQPIEPLEAVNE